jgi:hypothetical protein
MQNLFDLSRTIDGSTIRANVLRPDHPTYINLSANLRDFPEELPASDLCPPYPLHSTIPEGHNILQVTSKLWGDHINYFESIAVALPTPELIGLDQLLEAEMQPLIYARWSRNDSRYFSSYMRMDGQGIIAIRQWTRDYASLEPQSRWSYALQALWQRNLIAWTRLSNPVETLKRNLTILKQKVDKDAESTRL